jgi:hypothetical protein
MPSTNVPALLLTALMTLSCSGNTGTNPEVQEPDQPPPENVEPFEKSPAPEEPAPAPPETVPESPPPEPASPAPEPAPEPAPMPAQPSPPPAAEIKWGKPFIPHLNKDLPAKWTKCKKNKDCVVMDVDCCDQASVNQKYSKQAREKLPMTMCDMECGMEPVRAVCKKGKCGAQIGEGSGEEYFNIVANTSADQPEVL